MSEPVAFNREGARRVVRTVRRVEGMPTNQHPKRGRSGLLNTPQRGVFARIAASEPIGSTGAQWRYTVTQVDVAVGIAEGVISGIDVTDSANGFVDAPAVNVAEISATASYAGDVDRNGDDYPGGFAPRPVGGGDAESTDHVADSIVVIVGQVLGSDGETLVRLFRQVTIHDGLCEAPE